MPEHPQYGSCPEKNGDRQFGPEHTGFAIRRAETDIRAANQCKCNCGNGDGRIWLEEKMQWCRYPEQACSDPYWPMNKGGVRGSDNTVGGVLNLTLHDT
jgi:hypothetical protein